jgi:predicted MFS family arabinose efflux permease
MLSIYFIGTPLGSAIGIILGGHWGAHFGWRTAFLVAAIPGFVLAILALFIREPKRSEASIPTPSVPETIQHLFKTPSYIYNVLGTTALTFAVGGLAYWFPSFLSRVRGWEMGQAAQLFGSTTVIAGITGTLFGGFLADSWHQVNRKAYFLVSAIGMLLAAPTAVSSILIESKAWAFPFVFLTVFFLFFNTGPLNAAIISVVPIKMRATAMAINILIIHLFGDAISPLVIGRISDKTESLTIGMLVGCITIPIGAVILFVGANRLKKDQERL